MESYQDSETDTKIESKSDNENEDLGPEAINQTAIMIKGSFLHSSRRKR